MSLRRFLRELFKRDASHKRPPYPEDHLTEEIREATGPLAGGGMGGHLTGKEVYEQIEEHEHEEEQRRWEDADSD